MHGDPFAMTSLVGRAGLSQVSAFFFAEQIVLCDFGATRFPLARHSSDVDIETWCEASRARARRVTVLPDREISSVRLRLRMMRHELWIEHEAGGVDQAGYRIARRAAPAVFRYGLFVREEAEPSARLLAERFGRRFELETTRTYAFIHRRAPLLTR